MQLVDQISEAIDRRNWDHASSLIDGDEEFVETCRFWFDDDDGNTVIHKAAKCGAPRHFFDMLINSVGVKVFARNDNGDTPMHVAARYGHWGSIQALIDLGGSTESKNNNGDTVLHAAVRCDRTPTVRKLIDLGANVDASNKRGSKPLHLAVRNSNLVILCMLVNAGANVHARNSSGETPLFVAANSGGFALVDELLKAGAEVDAVDQHRMTALLVAVRDGNTETVKALLQRNASINVVEANTSMTPLHRAVENNYPEIVEILVQAGSNLTSPDKWQRTPIKCGSEGSECRRIIQAELDRQESARRRQAEEERNREQAAAQARARAIAEAQAAQAAQARASAMKSALSSDAKGSANQQDVVGAVLRAAKINQEYAEYSDILRQLKLTSAERLAKSTARDLANWAIAYGDALDIIEAAKKMCEGSSSASSSSAASSKTVKRSVCILCLDKPSTFIWAGCGHRVCCSDCKPHYERSARGDRVLSKCPICSGFPSGFLTPVYD